MFSHIEIQQLTSIEQLNELKSVEKAVWQMPPIPVHQTSTAMNNGGIILGAFHKEEMIGFLYSFAGFNGKEPYLCSHMLGIQQVYRKSGLGVEMKLKQAEIARKIGYPMITWTFDPLESKNAFINLHKLGARGAYYYENHYGDLHDQLNEGLPTDRIQVEWNLEANQKSPRQALDENKIMLEMDDNGFPIFIMDFTANFTSNVLFVAIPNDFQMLKKNNKELAKKWRFKTRKVFQKLFFAGYEAVDLLYDNTKKQSYYIFTNGGFSNDNPNERN